jgi:large subunit ribosomal protein L15
MPLFRRLPKRGFNNSKFATRCEIVNICQLERFEDGALVSIEQLSAAGLVDSIKSKVKILGKGDLTRKLEVSAHKFSKSAEEKIAASGGTAKVI